MLTEDSILFSSFSLANNNVNYYVVLKPWQHHRRPLSHIVYL